jgi:predicted transposase YbfD/YdcC
MESSVSTALWGLRNVGPGFCVCSPATAGAAMAGSDQASPGRRHDISINSISAATARRAKSATLDCRWCRLSAAAFAAAVRGHWPIENKLHWMLDVILA